ncbi:MAG: universal stress protein [Nitrospirales bacterium]|nr:universal stress protein [Nitrospira sp.]MDR4501311.1 universal stress protein [Nitrospirales bacterium]
MNEQHLHVPLINNIVHCSDFSPGSHTAFIHALKAALVTQSKLSILHVPDEKPTDWTEFPEVRKTLLQWKLIPKDSPRSAVPRLGIEVSKVIAQRRDPVKSVLSWLESHPTDLLVLATQQDKGRLLWFRRSVARPVSRKSRLMTLMIPTGLKGFVSEKDGTVSVKHIVIPIASDPDPQLAIQTAARVVYRLNCPSGRFTVLHVGQADQTPTVSLPTVPGWKWIQKSVEGHVTETILKTVKEEEADLLVMATAGRRGFLDALRGSHTEQILSKVTCPLLTIPAGGWMASLLQAEST